MRTALKCMLWLAVIAAMLALTLFVAANIAGYEAVGPFWGDVVASFR